MPTLMRTFAAVVERTRAELGEHLGRLVIGGRSMGGRAGSMLAADGFAADGLLLLAYPLHPAGKPEQLRDAHLPRITMPVLCFSGTRDPLCTPDIMRRVLTTVTSAVGDALARGRGPQLSRAQVIRPHRRRGARRGGRRRASDGLRGFRSPFALPKPTYRLIFSSDMTARSDAEPGCSALAFFTRVFRSCHAPFVCIQGVHAAGPCIPRDSRAAATGRGRGGGRGTPIQPGESCPAGTTEIRPRSCMAPENPAPSILDYRPRSTLVTPAHVVKTAKYPAIDFHGHPQGLLGSADGLATLGAALDSLNVRMMISADNMSGDRLKNTIANIQASDKMRDRVRVLVGIDFRNVGPGWAEKAVKQLEADVAAGAVGVGEIPKSFGLSIKKPDGSRLKIDDPELDPIWDACARLGCRCSSTPQTRRNSFSRSTTTTSAGSSSRSSPIAVTRRTAFRASRQLMTERDNLFRKHPKTTFVDGTHGMARQRSRPARQDARRDAQSVHGGRRGALRYRTPTARRARFLHQVSGSNSLRQGLLSAGRVPVLLARLRDARTTTSTTTVRITRSGSSMASIFQTAC